MVNPSVPGSGRLKRRRSLMSTEENTGAFRHIPDEFLEANAKAGYER